MTLRISDHRHASFNQFGSWIRLAIRALIALSAVSMAIASAAAQTPGVSATAPDFALSTPTGTSIRLSQETARGKTVLVVLRGYPGYQCPYCVRQVHDFIDHAAEFKAKRVNILLVYPGPPAELDQRAKEFLAKQAELPSNIKLVIDPDYTMTNLYGLRWDAPHETAYPSTFILDKERKILFEKISHGHGDRTTSEDVLAQLTAK